MKDTLHPGYGARLAQAREASSLTVADVAAKLKLTARQVEALEAEDVSRLPGDLFLRGFVRNYARLVDVNPDELISPVDASEAVSETITAHSEGVTLGQSPLRKWLLIPAGIFALFIVTVALLYQWLSQGEDALVADLPPQAVTLEAPLPSSAPGTSADGVAGMAPVNPIVVDSGTPVASADGADNPAEVSNVTSGSPPQHAPMPSPIPTPMPAPALNPKTPSALANATQPNPAEAQTTKPSKPVSSQADEGQSTGTGGHVLQFTASQDAWIQVVDGQGKRYSKLVRAGGSDTIKGMTPFKLVVGEAAQVNLSFDGRAIDLAPYIGQKVARLTLE